MKDHSIRSGYVLFAFWMFLAPVASTKAQVFPGHIRGTVTDTQGAVIASADVKLTAPAIGLERKAISDSNGSLVLLSYLSRHSTS